MGDNPTISQVEDYREDEQPDKQYGGAAHPPLQEADAAPEEVARKDRGRSPCRASQGIVKEESHPAHTAHPRDQGSEHPETGEEACHEDRLSPVPGEERFGPP